MATCAVRQSVRCPLPSPRKIRTTLLSRLASHVLRCFLPFRLDVQQVSVWTLMCYSETRWFCHYGASGSERHRDVLVWVQNRRQQSQSKRHDNAEDNCAPATRGHDGQLQSFGYCWRGGWKNILRRCLWQSVCSSTCQRSTIKGGEIATRFLCYATGHLSFEMSCSFNYQDEMFTWCQKSFIR